MFVQLQKDFLGKKPGERIDLDKEHADKLVEMGVATVVTDDLITPAVSRALESAFGKFTQALDGIVNESLKQFATVQSHSRKNAVPAIFGAGNEGDKNHNFADWLLCVRHGNAKRLEEEYGSSFADWGDASQKTAMTGMSGTAGGYTVPIEFLPRLLAAAAEQSVARPRATIVPMGSRTVQIPYLDVTNAPSSGDTAYFGGAVGRWTEEASLLNETEPSFRQLELVAHELSGYSLMSNTLLQDNAVGLEAVLMKLFGGIIAWYEDYGFLQGNGVGKPQGAFTAPAAISVSRSGGANTFVLADAAKMLGSLLPGWKPETTAWVINPTVLAQLIQLASTAGFVVWLNQMEGGAQKLPALKLLGLDVCISEKMSALGTARDVGLCDFGQYIIGDREMVEIAYSEHFKFTNNQATWRFVSRVDGQPWLRGKVTLADGTSTVSPYVYLT
jgi:HK97 family phage major capsid protein